MNITHLFENNILIPVSLEHH